MISLTPSANPTSLSDATLVVLAIITAVVVLATALITLYITIISRREVKQVHYLVNSRMTEKLNRIEQLTEALVESNTAVPPDPHDPDPPTIDF